MLASILTTSSILAIITAAVGLVLLSGVIAGQFRRGVVSELRDALQSANNEIQIERGRGDRIEKEAKEQKERFEKETRDLRDQVQALTAQVATLQSVLRDDRQIAALVAAELKNELRQMLTHDDEKLQEQIALGVARGLEAPTNLMTAAIERMPK